MTLKLLKRKDNKLIKNIPHSVKEYTLPQASKSVYFWLLFICFLCTSFGQMFLFQNASLIILEGLESSIGRENALTVILPAFLVVLGFAGLLGGLGWGFIVDKIGGPWKTLPVLYFSSAILILLFYSGYNNVILIMLLGFLTFLGLQGEPTVHYASISYVFGMRHLGKIMTTLQAFSVGIGISTGPYVGAYIKDITGSYFWAIMLVVGLRIIATIASLVGLVISRKNQIVTAKNLA